MTQSDKFNASSSIAGYLFQCRLALLRGLQTLKRKSNGQISIERFDDISYENDDLALCLTQAKHHVTAKSLNDLSVDVWKTIRVWVTQLQTGVLASADLRFNLITTACAEPGSAMELLRLGASLASVAKANKMLRATAKSSTNKESQSGRDAFLSLSEKESEIFLSRVEVYDRHPNLIDVMQEIEGELVLLSPEHVSSVAEYLEGWWLGKVGQCLVNDGNATIPLQNIIVKANEIGNLFKAKGLPIDDPSTLGVKEYSVEDEERLFVKQMRILALNEGVVRRGVQDFYRAYAQRSK